MTFRAISYGAGGQSTALLVLACTGRIEADAAIFANVGEKAEHPESLAYFRDVAVPYAAEHGFPLVEVRRHETSTSRPDLMDTMVDYDGDRVKEPIPIRNRVTGAPTGRNCTADWKVKAIQNWLTANGHIPGVSLIGISVDEIERASGEDTNPNFPREYPLLHLGLNRGDCYEIIRQAGLPAPRKSSCFFCPFHKPQTWAEMRRDEPVLFRKAQELEDLLVARRSTVQCPGVGREPRDKDGACPSCCEQQPIVDGRIGAHIYPPAYLTRFGKRLSDAIPAAQDALFDAAADFGSDIGEDGCDEGTCFV